VAKIAMHYLSDSTRSKVLSILGDTSPEDAAFWMDKVRGDKEYDYMKPWHYINIPKGSVYKPSTEQNIVNVLIRETMEIRRRDISAKERKTHLMILMHLVGDLHQPLHVGYGEDKGGNTVQVDYRGVNMNLHSIWDSKLIHDNNINDGVITIIADNVAPELRASWVKGDIISWMEQVRTNLGSVYDFRDNKIGDEYIEKSRSLIQISLLFAGLRLASLLENTLSDFTAATRHVPNQPPVDKELAKALAEAPSVIQIAPKDAEAFIGHEVKVCGKVFGVTHIKSKGITFINMGKSYPNNPFAVVVFDDVREKFTTTPESLYENHSICVTGIIVDYKEKPQIIISDQTQIVVRHN
jgi:hypothetical protein